MSLSNTLSKVAANVIKQFGVLCTFTHEATGSFDPVTGIKTSVDTVFTGYGVKDSYTQQEVDGTSILVSDIKLVLSKTSQAPQVDDTCAIGSDSYRVMSVKQIDPDNVDIIYEVQLRL